MVSARVSGIGARLTLYSKRLPHVVTRKDLAILLVPTYAAGQSVDEDIAQERLDRAVQIELVLSDLYSGLSMALFELQGPRTSEDDLIDRLSKGVEKRRARVKAAPPSPGISAVLVRIDVEIGHAPEMMRGALETPKGKALLQTGLRELGKFWLKELLK